MKELKGQQQFVMTISTVGALLPRYCCRYQNREENTMQQQRHILLNGLSCLNDFWRMPSRKGMKRVEQMASSESISGI